MGRVAGYTYRSLFINNIAWDGLKINDGTVIGGTATNEHGADITAAQAKDKATYTGLGWSFDGNSDASPWKMGAGEYKLPVLYWQTTDPAPMPEHLK